MRIGFIGCGNMGSAILYGIIDNGLLAKENIVIYDKSEALSNRLKGEGYNAVSSLKELVEGSDIIFMAVKPQFVGDVIPEIRDILGNRLVVSIVAGYTVERYKKAMPGARILRCMPNTPALVGEGVFAVDVNNDADDEELKLVSSIFESIGHIEWISEKMIDAYCGLSGGGPAYVAMFIEALADGAVLEGVPRVKAYEVAARTVMGSAKLILEKNMQPSALKDMVCSPGGTTIEGLYKLEQGGFRASVMDAIVSSTEKSKKL